MGKVWVLDTETKGTGANVVPLEKVLERPAPSEKPARRPKRATPEKSSASETPGSAAEPRSGPRRAHGGKPRRTSTALPPGHVRKKATGEIGKVQAVDPRAGTATVRWLKSGASSTVPLSAVTRR
jgi:hypothetical protein